MTTTSFYVGVIPTRPLVITLRNPDLTPFDLSGYASAELVGDLPSGVATITDPVNGKLQYTFTSPFTTAGVIDFRVKLLNSSGGADLAEPMAITVYDDAPGSMQLVAPDEAERITGTPVSVASLARAQAVISLVVDRDLQDTILMSTLSTSDTSYLKQAVAWQAEGYEKGIVHEDALQNVASLSLGDATVQYANGDSGMTPFLAPLARLSVMRLSWFGHRTHIVGRVREGRLSPLISDAHQWKRI